MGLNDGSFPNINGAALLERALSGTNFGNTNQMNQLNQMNHINQMSQTMAGLNNATSGVQGNCIINHNIGLNPGNQLNQMNFGNSAHFTGGGGVDSGGGSSCNQNIGIFLKNSMKYKLFCLKA